MAEQAPEKEQVNIRLSENMTKLIDKAIKKGYANDRSEFIRMAIVERLKALGLLEDVLLLSRPRTPRANRTCTRGRKGF